MVRVDESVKRMYECRGGDKYKNALPKKLIGHITRNLLVNPMSCFGLEDFTCADAVQYPKLSFYVPIIAALHTVSLCGSGRVHYCPF